MRRRIRDGMVQFATDMGAIRGGRADWYAVAEHLAETYAPQLLGDLPASRPAHRPRRDWFWLVRDVGLVRQRENCTIQKACWLLAKGKAFPNVVTLPKGESIRVQAGKWVGMKPGTLEQRYYEWIREWKEISAEAERIEAPMTPTSVRSITATVRARHQKAKIIRLR
jgi:hypothetical protein